MERVQHRIMDEYLGEQPVGTAFLESTGRDDYPWIAHAPTMRVPGGIDGTDQVYQACWAAFVAVHRHNLRADRPIAQVVFPSMGTGFGGMSFSESALQMAAAWRHYVNPPHRLDWDHVIERHRNIAYDGREQAVKR